MIGEIREYTKKRVSQRRFRHILGVEKLAFELCMKYGVKGEKGRAAALLHDCTKEKKYEEQLKLAEKYNIILEYSAEKFPQCVHADTAAEVARHVFGLDDDVCNAIKYHTVARENMDILEKIIFVADKCEKGRDKELEKAPVWRRTAFQNIDRAVYDILRDNCEYLEKHGKPICENTRKALESLKEIVK